VIHTYIYIHVHLSSRLYRNMIMSWKLKSKLPTFRLIKIPFASSPFRFSFYISVAVSLTYCNMQQCDVPWISDISSVVITVKVWISIIFRAIGLKIMNVIFTRRYIICKCSTKIFESQKKTQKNINIKKKVGGFLRCLT